MGAEGQLANQIREAGQERGNREWHVFVGELGDLGHHATEHSWCSNTHMSWMSSYASADEVPTLRS